LYHLSDCGLIIDNHLSAAPKSEGIAPAISLTENALKHFNKMRSERNEDLCLRIGVKQGGCSGMSYTMDFESKENARPDDSIIEYNGFEIGNSLCFHSPSYVKLG
jgi:iron-sulfur cluster assembly protein